MKYITIAAIIFLTSSVPQFGQKNIEGNVIEGEVKNEVNKPVRGVTIYIDGVKTGYTTNKNGYYRISIKPEAQKILILSSEHGYGESDIKGQKTINFTLNKSEDYINRINEFYDDEEMMEVGYGKVSKKNNPTSAKNIDRQKFRFSSYTDMYQLLRHEVPSVRIVGSDVIIQGRSTLGGNNAALFVVDGRIVEQINDLNPGDVESISVLSGANAAVYGMRGANGVILVTTSRGSDR